MSGPPLPWNFPGSRRPPIPGANGGSRPGIPPTAVGMSVHGMNYPTNHEPAVLSLVAKSYQVSIPWVNVF